MNHALDWFKIFLTEQATDFPSRTYETTEGVCVSGSRSSVGDSEESLKFLQ